MKNTNLRTFSKEEQQTWKLLFQTQSPKRKSQIHDIFSRGLETLKFSDEKIPDLHEVNRILQAKTGFQGVPVDGLEEAACFFSLLAERKFPIGNFIRDRNDLSYTPAPDVFHDLYGHIPFLADKDYADFSYQFGIYASRFADSPPILRQFERLYWFGVEFPLITTANGLRIFGGGIASSHKECDYALGKEPVLLPFDLSIIRYMDYKIDELQNCLFVLNSPEQLYSSVKQLYESFYP